MRRVVYKITVGWWHAGGLQIRCLYHKLPDNLKLPHPDICVSLRPGGGPTPECGYSAAESDP